MKTVSLALVNDYEVVVRGLHAMLRSYQHQVEVVELDVNRTVSCPVDIALVDTFANHQRADKALLHLAQHPLVGKVAVYSWNLDPLAIDRALTSGARGYISKSLPAGELIEALVAIHSGRQQVWQGTGASRSPVAGDWPGREEGLTMRESEVLALITQGMSNQQIVELTGLSINSVKSYIRSAYRRIGATSRSNAILWGIDHGFRPDASRLYPLEVPNGAGSSG